MYMFTIFEKCIDLVFPPRKTELEVRQLTEPELLSLYRPQNLGACTALMSYTKSTAQSLITENKYHGNHRAATLLSTLLQKHFAENLHSYIFVPIPLSQERQKARGYNQVTNILETLTREHNIRIDETLLIRTRDTKPQTSLAKQERQINMRDSFAVTDKISAHRDKTIVLVDDVVTTGATLGAARAALAPHLPPNRLLCIAFAH